MPTIDSLPDKSVFGTQFDYSVWGPGTEVTLCNVPWDSMYRDVYWWNTPERAIDYIMSYNDVKHLPTITIKNMTYCAQGMPVRINIPFSEANTFNYLIVRNNAFPIQQKNRATTFFYFIQSVDYVAPETTQLSVMLDVWTTYHHLVKFGDAFVERSHMWEWFDKKYKSEKLSRTHKWPFFARNYLKETEGFSLGEKHMIYRSWISSLNDSTGKFSNRYNFDAIIVSTINLEGDLGTTGNPTISSAYGANIPYGVGNDSDTETRDGGRIVSGANLYICPFEKLPGVMRALSNAPWAAQGIMDIYYVPKPNMAISKAAGKVGDAGLGKINKVYTNKAVTLAEHITPLEHVDWFKERNNNLSERHLGLLHRFGKFFTSPYCYYEVTANNGHTITLSPEMMKDMYNIVMKLESHILPPSPRIVGYIYGYNSTYPSHLWKGDMEYLDDAIVIDNFPHVPVVNDQSAIWYASHANSIAQSRSAASWGRDKASRAADTSYDAAMRGIRTSSAMNENNIGANNLHTATANTAQMAHQQVASANRAVSGIGGAVGSALSGNLTGAFGGLGNYFMGQVSSDINTGIDINARNMNNTINANLMRANQAEQNWLNGANATANRDLAKWAAQGDYQQSIAAINASVKDAEVTPPTVAGATGGDAFNWLINGAVIHTRLRMVSPDIILKQGMFWERYGYAVNTFMRQLPSRLRCMSRFTYWKCQNVRITSSSVPQIYIETLRGILEKGVTVWHSPPQNRETVDVLAMDNAPINWEREQ